MKMEKTYRFKNHFCKVLEDNYICLFFLIGSLIPVVQEIFLDGKLTGDSIFSILVSVVCIVIIIINISYWKKTSVCIDEKSLVYEKNTLNKKTLTINLKDISNVNVSRNIFEAITGTRTVKLDINSTAATETEVTICLKKSDAELFERLVVAKEMAEEENVSKEATNDIEENTGAGIKEVLAHSFFSLKFIAMLGLSVFFGFAATIPGSAEEEIITWLDVGRGAGIITIIVAIAAGGTTFIKQLFVYYGFIAYREGNDIIISYGIFNKHNFRMPVDKISAVSITTSLIGRVFDRSHIQIKCIGVGDEETEKSIITLSLSKQRLHQELLRLLPEFLPEEMKDSVMMSRNDMDKEPAKVKILYTVYGLIFILLVFVSGGIALTVLGRKFLPSLISLVVLLVAYIVIFIVGKYHTSGYFFGKNHMVLCNGILSRTTTIVRYKTIENVTLSQGPIDRRLKICSGHIAVKASLVGEVMDICYIGNEAKEKLLERYLG